jgi:hypothetical protein
VQTYTDLATMEAANEAARRAVNAILEASGSDAEPCDVWKLRQPGGIPFQLAREADRVIYRLFGASQGPPPAIQVTDALLKRLRSLPTP